MCKSPSDLLRIMQEACDNLFARASHEVFGHKPTFPNEYYKQHPLTIFVLAPEIAKKKQQEGWLRNKGNQLWLLMYGLTQEAAHIALWAWLTGTYDWSHEYDMCLTHALLHLSQAVLMEFWVENSEENKKKNGLLVNVMLTPHSFYMDHECALWLWETRDLLS